MLFAFVLCAGLVMTSCETADPVDDSKDSDIIAFADEIVKKSCVEAFDTDGDGEVSYDEAAAVKDLANVTLRFKENFLTFDEFQYFTNVKVIPESFFSPCNMLKSLVLPESLRFIDDYGLSCSSLTKIELPQNVENFGYLAFIFCSNLKEVYVRSPKPFSWDGMYVDGFFPYCYKLERIYVPIESVELYKKTFPWSTCADIIVGYYF